MKITYIITPFKSSLYLVRCINSILRQTEKNNEIIVAENFFDTPKVEEYLRSVDGLKLISDKPQSDVDKIKEAVSLAEDDSFIHFISVNTVATPVASQTVAETDAEIIAVSHGVKNNDVYSVALMNETSVVDTDKADLQSLFIKKKHLSDISADVISQKIPFELWIDKKLLEGVPGSVSDELCFYLSVETLSHDADAEYCLKNKAEVLEIVDGAVKDNSIKGIFLFDKYLSILYKLLISPKNDLTVKSGLFDIIKEIGERAKENDFARRIYGLYLGADIEQVSNMDTEAYLFYANRLMSPVSKAQVEHITENIVAPIQESLSSLTSSLNNTRATQNSQLKRINDLEKKAKSANKVIKSLRKSGLVGEPQKQIPALYAQGKFGLRVLIKSAVAWLKNKLSRKKK